jgi:fatty acid desaturase
VENLSHPPDDVEARFGSFIILAVVTALLVLGGVSFAAYKAGGVLGLALLLGGLAALALLGILWHGARHDKFGVVRH